MIIFSSVCRRKIWSALLFVVGSISAPNISAAEPGRLNAWFGTKAVEPLPPEQAFQVSARLLDPSRISVQFTLKPDYYLYKDKVSLEIKGSTGVKLLRTDYPTAITKQDRSFGPTQVYPESFEIRGTIANTEKTSTPITLIARYQGCFETLGVCYPPQTTEIKLNPSSSTVSGKPLGKKQQ